MKKMLFILIIALISSSAYAADSFKSTADILDRFEAQKNYSWLENTGIPAAKKLLEYFADRKGVIVLDSKESIEGNRWFSDSSEPAKSDLQYNFIALKKLVDLAKILDPKREDWAKGFDYNRVVDVASAQTVNVWKETNALKSVDIDFQDKDLNKRLKGKTFLVDSRPVIEIDGLYFTLTQKYFFNREAFKQTGIVADNVFGPSNAFIDEYLDMAINSIAYKENADVAEMYSYLADFYKNDKRKNKKMQEEVDLYSSEAQRQKDVVYQYLWDNDQGTFFNYSHYTHQKYAHPQVTAGYAFYGGLFDVTKPEEAKMASRQLDYLIKELVKDIKKENGTRDKIVRGLKEYSKKFADAGMNAEAGKCLDTANMLARNGK